MCQTSLGIFQVLFVCLVKLTAGSFYSKSALSRFQLDALSYSVNASLISYVFTDIYYLLIFITIYSDNNHYLVLPRIMLMTLYDNYSQYIHSPLLLTVLTSATSLAPVQTSSFARDSHSSSLGGRYLILLPI